MDFAKRTWLPLLLLLALVAVTAHAQQPSGELELEKGRVKIRHQSEDRIVEETGKRIPVFEGDVVHSAAGTRAKIYFRGGQDVVSLYSNTILRVDKVSQENTFFGLNIGKALFSVLSRFRNNKFNVRTPTATIGVKGTEFVTGSDGLKTFVLTVSGTVGLTSIEFPKQEVIVSKNQASRVEPKQAPSPAVDVPPAAQEQILTQEGVEQFEEIPFQAPAPAAEGENKEGGEEEGEEKPAEEGEVVDTEVDVEDVEIPEDVLGDILEQVDQVAEVQTSIQESTEAVSEVDDPGLPEETSGPQEVNITVTR